MAILEINGRRVEVDDSFRTLSPEQQQATVEEIAASIGASSQPALTGADAMRARGLRSPDPAQANASAEKDLASGLSEGFVQENPALSRLASAASGIPFVGEWTDEGLGALTNALTGVDTTETIRQAQDAMAEARPKENAALRFGGGVLGSLPAVALAPYLGAAAPQALGMRTLVGLGTGAVGGGFEGAVSGAGANEQDRAAGAREGAGTGALVGGAVGAAAPLVSAGVNNFARYIRGTDIAAIAETLGVSPSAAKAIKATLDGEDLDAAAAAIQRGGPDAMLVEGGPALQALGDAVGNTGGGATRVMKGAIEGRTQKAAGAVHGALDDATKPGTALIPALPRTGTLYDRAYSRPIDYSSAAGRRIEDLLPRIPKEEWAKARKLIEMDPDIPEEIKRQYLVSIAEDGSRTGTTMPSLSVGLDPSRVTKAPMPSVLELDYVTRSLKDTARAGDGKGALGGNTNQGRIYGKVAGRLRSAMREAVPEYAQALDFASTEIAVKEARDFGATILRPSVTRDQVADVLKGAPFAERQAAKAALRTSLDDTLANTRAVISRAGQGTEVSEAIKAVRDLSSRAARDKLALVLGPQEARNLTDALDQAATAFEISSAMAGNSKTAVRQAVQGSVSESASMGPLGRLMAGEPLGASKRFAQIFTGSSPEAVAAREAGIMEEIAGALTKTKGPDAQRALATLKRVMAGQKINDAHAQRLAHWTTTALAGAGYTAGTQAAGQ